MQEISITTQDNIYWTFDKSVCCKRDHVWRWFLSSPLVLSRLTAAVGFLSGSGSSMRYNVKLEPLTYYILDSGTQHHNKMIFESALFWIGRLQFSLCFASS